MKKKADNQNILIITKSKKPYTLHNITYLALPFGTTYKFRYQREHFSYDESDNLEDLKNKLGLLVLFDEENSKYLPLRKFTISEIEEYGDYIFLTLRFYDYVFYSRDTDHKEQTDIEYYDNKIRTLLKSSCSGDQSKLILYLPINLDLFIKKTANVPDQYKCWNNLVYLLSELSVFSGISFVKIASIFSVDKEEEQLPQLLDNGLIGYKLHTNKNYILKLVQMNPKYTQTTDIFSLEFITLPSQISSLSNSMVIDGAYDRLDFLFETLPQMNSKNYSQIIITCKHKNQTFSENNNDNVFPDLNIPFQIEWTNCEKFKKSWLPLITLCLGILLWIFAKPISVIPLITKLNIVEEYLRYISIFFLCFAFQSWSSFINQFKITNNNINNQL